MSPIDLAADARMAAKDLCAGADGGLKYFVGEVLAATPPEHSFVLVMDQAWDSFAEASEAIERLYNSFSKEELCGLDLFAHPPSTLACLLRFTSHETAIEAGPAIAAEAERGRWRTLDVSSLTKLELEHFFARMLPRFAFGEMAVTDPRSAFDRLLEALALAAAPGGTPQPDGGIDAAMSIEFSSSQLMLAAMAHELSREGVYVESGILPQIGEDLIISLSTGSGQGPCRLTARVKEVYGEGEAERAHRKPGFFAEFLLVGEERNLFEAFLIAAARGKRWPERSGRRFERFPIRLCAEYDYGGRRRIETTGNLSRGGVFLLSANPPALGAELKLSLSAPGQSTTVELAAVVVHVRGETTREPGAGVRFTDPADLVRARLAQLLGERGTPKMRTAMVVDDDRFFRTILRGELERGGYSVLEAKSGEDAFELLLTQLLRLDILILDVHMPGMRGDELLRRIAEVGRDPELAVAVLTGDALDDASTARFLELGADVVLTKRHAPDEILTSLNSVLRRTGNDG